MKGSIALGWLLATIIFALLGDAWLTVAFLFFAAIFSFFTLSNEYRAIRENIFSELVKGETDEG